MEKKERIKVYICIQDGKTVCICKRGKKGCNKKCEPDVVIRDKFIFLRDATCKQIYLLAYFTELSAYGTYPEYVFHAFSFP